jgi:hypothetical protein
VLGCDLQKGVGYPAQLAQLLSKDVNHMAEGVEGEEIIT